MTARKASINDLPSFSRLLSGEGISDGFLKVALRNASDSAVIDDGGVKGFVLIRKLPGVNEVSYWLLGKGDGHLFDSFKNPLCVTERESSKARISFLKKSGFRKSHVLEGIYSGERAVVLVKD